MKRLIWVALLAGCGTAPSRPSTVTPLAQTLRPVWNADARFALALSNAKVVYAGGDLVCADGATGQVRWRAKVETGEFFQAGESDGLVVVYEGSGALRSFDRESGKEIGVAGTGVVRGRLTVAGGRAYVWNEETAAAYDSRTLQRAWEWPPADYFQIRRLVADTRHVALDVRSKSSAVDDACLLDFATGIVATRHVGRVVGWHDDDMYVEKKGEIWIWRGDKLVQIRWLNGYEGSGLLIHAGDVLYVAVNRYFTGERARVTPERLTPVPQSVQAETELVRQGSWHLPVEGPLRLFDSTLVEEQREGLLARHVVDGTPLWEARGHAISYSIGGGYLYVVTRETGLSAYRLGRL